MWEPQPLATLRASTACTEITLPYFNTTTLYSSRFEYSVGHTSVTRFMDKFPYLTNTVPSSMKVVFEYNRPKGSFCSYDIAYVSVLLLIEQGVGLLVSINSSADMLRIPLVDFSWN
jgi:hypothetical protein